MKAVLVLALAAATLILTVPPVAAGPPEDVPACVGYEWCHEATGNGWAVFCVAYKQSWICGECEACGNEPHLPIKP